jgi:type VI secretion system protein ImpH
MLVLRQRTPTGLEALLKRRLKFDCHIKSLQHRWVAIPPEQRSRIGKQHAELGKTLLVGARLEDYNKVCIAIHADNYEMFQRLLPGGSDRQQLDRAISLYARDPINYEVELTLPTSHIPPWRLGQSGALGRNAWLGLPKTAAVCCS